MRLRHLNVPQQRPVVLQECPLLALPRNTLQAPQIQIDSINVALHVLLRTDQRGRIILAELRDDRTVDRRRGEGILSVLGSFEKYLRIEHWGVRKLGTVSKAQGAKVKFVPVHHQRHDVPRRPDLPPVRPSAPRMAARPALIL